MLHMELAATLSRENDVKFYRQGKGNDGIEFWARFDQTKISDSTPAQ